MDVFTAGTALILVQLCVALISAGIFSATPSEKCTRYWALSGICIATGVLAVVLNAGQPRYPVLILGNNLLIVGVVLQWHGIRAFFRKSRGYAGWTVAVLFFLAYLLLLVQGATVSQRGLLSAIAVLTMLCLMFYEVWSGEGRRSTFARRLTLAALALMMLSYGYRVIGTIANPEQYVPNSNGTMSVIVIYLVPIIGTLLLSSGLLLLYFERIIADKHHLATHDELTGLLNRRAIVAGGERELAMATRFGRPLTIAFADIDHFKDINDTLGHEAGDVVISEIARTLSETCRNVDLIGRYGGEEFCMVFPGVGADGAEVLGKRLLDAVAEFRFSNGRPVTISIGLATVSPTEIERDWACLIRRADKALYHAKESGRNRFCIG